MNRKRLGATLLIIFYALAKVDRYYGLADWVHTLLGLALFGYLGWIVVDGIIDMAKNRSRT